MPPTRRIRLLQAGNALLLVLLVAVCMHEGYMQRAYRRLFVPPPPPHVYTDNTYFGEAADFASLYPSQPAIVMMGNSMVEKIEWHELLGRCDVATRGVNGDVMAGILARVDGVIALHPKIVFIEGGINDIDLQHPVAEIARDLQQTAQRLQQAGIIPVLMAVVQVTNAYPESGKVNATIAQLNSEIASTAAAHHLDLINLNATLAPGNILDPVYARGDGCHLTAKAYLVWKAEILRILAARHI